MSLTKIAVEALIVILDFFGEVGAALRFATMFAGVGR